MKKLKRILLFASLSATFAFTAFSAVACGEEHTTHTWNDGVVTKEATCAEEGTTTYTCTVCGTTKEESISATGEHTWNEGVSTATCTEDGKITYTCTVCGTTKEENATATGHVWDENGYCTVCNAYSGRNVTVLNADGTPAEGVIVKAANEKDGILFETVTDKDGIAHIVGTEDKSYQIQLYNLPDGVSYEIVKNEKATDDEENNLSLTLKSGTINSFESEGEIKTSGTYSVTVPLDQDYWGEPTSGTVPVTLTCDYIGGATYVISWNENYFPVIRYSIGTTSSDPYSADTTNTDYDSTTGTYSFSFLLSYNETATIGFEGFLKDWLGGYLNETDFPYTYSFNVNVLEAPVTGSEQLPFAISLGDNDVKGIAFDGGYYAYVNLTVDTAGDYTFTLGENVTATYQSYDSSWNLVDIELTNGGILTSTAMWSTTYKLYVVSDSENIEIGVAFSYTPGSLNAPFELQIGTNNQENKTTNYYTFTPEVSGKYTLKSSNGFTFGIYASKDDVETYNSIAVGELIVYSFEAGKTYYISAAYAQGEFTFGAYDAETDSGYSKDDPRELTLDKAEEYVGSAIYYMFTPAENGNYSVTIDSISAYGSISVYSDSNFENIVKECYETSITFKAEADTTYYILVHPYANGTVTITESEEEEQEIGTELILGEAATLVPLEYANFFYFTATKDGTYQLKASESTTVIYETLSDYEAFAGTTQGADVGTYSFEATADETYYFSLYSGDGGTITLSEAGGEEELVIHGTFQIGSNTFTAMSSNKESYNATLSVDKAGTYTFTFSSDADNWSKADVKITINGTTYTASSYDGQNAVEIPLSAGDITISITCSLLGAEITLVIS